MDRIQFLHSINRDKSSKSIAELVVNHLAENTLLYDLIGGSANGSRSLVDTIDNSYEMHIVDDNVDRIGKLKSRLDPVRNTIVPIYGRNLLIEYRAVSKKHISIRLTNK